MTPEHKQRLAATIDAMRSVSSGYYAGAVMTHCHPFIEFAGFINEYIDLCRGMLEREIDFTESNQHSGIALPIETFQAAYIGEKFGCIFGPSLSAHPKLLEAFLASAFGADVMEKLRG